MLHSPVWQLPFCINRVVYIRFRDQITQRKLAPFCQPTHALTYLVKLLQYWCESSARWTPVSWKVEGQDLLVGQYVLGFHLAAVEAEEIGITEKIHCSRGLKWSLVPCAYRTLKLDWTFNLNNWRGFKLVTRKNTAKGHRQTLIGFISTLTYLQII